MEVVMKFNDETQVKEIALAGPAAKQVLEDAGVDYCCGGSQTLREACFAAKVPAGEILLRLEENKKQATADEKDWMTEPLANLTQHIRETHHRYVRESMPRIKKLLGKVNEKHGANHPEIAQIDAIFAELGRELTMHMQKEEMILFPYIEALERSRQNDEPLEVPFFQTVQNPIRTMIHDHDAAGVALRKMSSLSNEYTAPPEACLSYQELYRSLDVFEKDLHTHVHLENNILFPRAVELEAAAN
jgi:regulator of cell morphogenesis and NO signaling